jgi:predicted GH43/DUF377 family glycosyl hydrolase
VKWNKLGLFLEDICLGNWHASHYSVPIGEQIDKNFLRVYLSGRDKLNRSHTTSVILDIEKNFKLIEIAPEPTISPGKNGMFDQSGAMATWIYKNNSGEKFMYYIGWNLAKTTPFRNSIGLAKSSGNNDKYEKISDGPILDRSIFDPGFVASCCVEKVKSEYYMWYLSCDDWLLSNDSYKAKYNIKLAKSKDLINWDREGLICIDYNSPEEYAISRPSVFRENDQFKMWYSTKGENYKIGYAESIDGVNWVRKDKLSGISTSERGWDSEMVEYPHVLEINSQKYMLYNGNGYGLNGFGIAIFEE